MSGPSVVGAVHITSLEGSGTFEPDVDNLYVLKPQN
jgi:hypothetical protein